MNRILKISLILFAIIILASTAVQATGIDMNLSSNTSNTTNTTNNTNNNNVVDDTVLGGNVNGASNTANTSNVSTMTTGNQQELSQGQINQPTSSAALSSSTLGISNIINIILIVLGLLLILLGIAILIRLR